MHHVAFQMRISCQASCPRHTGFAQPIAIQVSIADSVLGQWWIRAVCPDVRTRGYTCTSPIAKRAFANISLVAFCANVVRRLSWSEFVRIENRGFLIFVWKKCNLCENFVEIKFVFVHFFKYVKLFALELMRLFSKNFHAYAVSDYRATNASLNSAAFAKIPLKILTFLYTFN